MEGSEVTGENIKEKLPNGLSLVPDELLPVERKKEVLASVLFYMECEPSEIFHGSSKGSISPAFKALSRSYS